MVFSKVYVADCRKMQEVKNDEIGLVVTSPPYWHIKDYGVPGQIGYGESLHEYLKDLYLVWQECFRVLQPGARLCINIGDQFLRTIIYGRYKVAPLHAEIISQCEKIGFDYMGSIIWRKKTTMNTTGGATVMGSYPFPPNGLIEIDYEFILILKKPGKKGASPEVKEKSRMTPEEWKDYFSGHWNFAGERQINHEAMFPEELPKRLIRMFTFINDIVLDPFLGSGTTLKVARENNRSGIGYEINEKYLQIIKEKLGITDQEKLTQIEIIKREVPIEVSRPTDYEPSIQDARPIHEPTKFRFSGERLYRVVEILSENSLELDTGLTIKLWGIEVKPDVKEGAKDYLERCVKGKQVSLKFALETSDNEREIPAYVFLKNKIFVNKEMVRQGYAAPADYPFDYQERFRSLLLKSQTQSA